MTYDTFFWWKANLQFSIWDFYKIFISKIKNRKRSIEFQGVSPPCMKNWIYFHIFINKFLSLVLKLLFLLINTFYAHNVFDIKRLVKLQTFIIQLFNNHSKNTFNMNTPYTGLNHLKIILKTLNWNSLTASYWSDASATSKSCPDPPREWGCHCWETNLQHSTCPHPLPPSESHG